MTPLSYIKSQDTGMVISFRAIEDPNLDARFGINVGEDTKLAGRLMRAIDSGKAITNLRVATDVNGEQYLECDATKVMGRYLSVDLKRLGF
jgi:hypothetical protein